MSVLCMAVHCCVLEGMTIADRHESITILGTVGNTVKLLGYLENPTQSFYKDDQAVYTKEHIYQLTKTPAGFAFSLVQMKALTG